MSAQHWAKGAAESLDAARTLLKDHKNALALFLVHLAVEKLLKAHLVAASDAPPPKTHNLVALALHLRNEWLADDMQFLQSVTPFALEARYDDFGWMEREENTSKAPQFVEQAEKFFERFPVAL